MTRRLTSAAAGGRLLAVVMGLIALASCGSGGGTPPASPPPPTPVGNTASVTVGFGALGAAGGYTNGIWTTVTVCAPGSTTNCVAVPDVLVDTGSVGLRVLSSALGSLQLPPITDGSNPANPLQECIQFADFSYIWGPVVVGNVQIAGETAAQVPGQAANSGIPIHVIGSSPYVVPASCITNPPGGGVATPLDTLQALGGNGILGIGNFPQDCGSSCASGSQPYYFLCPGGVCSIASVPEQLQVFNPVSAFTSDNNGVLITLPSVAAGGAPSVTGTLIFGIGTQSNNALGSAKVYEIDGYGNFPQVTLNGVNYMSGQNTFGGFIDSGSNALYISDATTLASTGIVECAGNLQGYYCPASTVQLTPTVFGANSVSAPVQLSVANAATLINSGNAVFNNVGGDSGIGLSTDYVDLGIPFFLGKSVFVGIEGTNATYPNGYWAF